MIKLYEYGGKIGMHNGEVVGDYYDYPVYNGISTYASIKPQDISDNALESEYKKYENK